MLNRALYEAAKQGAVALSGWRDSHPDDSLDLRRADFTHCDLSGCDFSSIDLQFADFRWSDLERASFKNANLTRAEFHKADLSHVDFSNADLRFANLEDAVLNNASLMGAIFGRTRLYDADLSKARDVESIIHEESSFINEEAITKSQHLPDEFLRGCGLFLPFQATVYRVVIGSPSDVEAEREATRQAINLWNQLNSETMKVVLLPLMWEIQSTPTYSKESLDYGPQSVINEQMIARGDILIALFWSRIGTPTKKAKSGTLEEIDEFVAKDRPAMLYFSKRPLPQDHDQKQFKLLKTWKKKVKKEALIAEFDTVESLAQRLREDLTAVVNRLKQEHLTTSEEAVLPLDGIHDWLATDNRFLKIGIATPRNGAISKQEVIDARGQISGILKPKMRYWIQAFVITDKEYPQGKSSIDESGGWHIAQIHLGTQTHRLFFRVFDATNRMVASSEEITVLRQV